MFEKKKKYHHLGSVIITSRESVYDVHLIVNTIETTEPLSAFVSRLCYFTRTPITSYEITDTFKNVSFFRIARKTLFFGKKKIFTPSITIYVL